MTKKTVVTASVASLALAVAFIAAYQRMRRAPPTAGQLTDIDALAGEIQSVLANPESKAAQQLGRILRRLSQSGVHTPTSIAEFLLEQLEKLREAGLTDNEAISLEDLLNRLEAAADQEGI